MTNETNDAVDTNDTNDNVASGSLLSGAEATNTTETTDEAEVVTTNEAVAEENEYDYVPAKFLDEDGKPDWQRLANSYSELEKKQGSKVAPKTVEDYDFAFSNEDVFDKDADLGDVKNQMLELGISKEQFGGVMGMWETAVVDIVNQIQGTPEMASETLKEAWGEDMDSNLVHARNAWDAFATDDMDINTVGNNPAVIQLLASIGSQMGEDVRPPAGGNAGTGMTQTDVSELMNRPDYWTNSELQAKVAGYYESKNK